jgi:hypothetical protein
VAALGQPQGLPLQHAATSRFFHTSLRSGPRSYACFAACDAERGNEVPQFPDMGKQTSLLAVPRPRYRH